MTQSIYRKQCKRDLRSLGTFCRTFREKLSVAYSRVQQSKEIEIFFLLPHSKETIITNYFRHYTSPRVFQTQSLGKMHPRASQAATFLFLWLVFDVSRTYHLFRTFFSVERSRKVSYNRSTCVGNFLPFSPDDVKRPRF